MPEKEEQTLTGGTGNPSKKEQPQTKKPDVSTQTDQTLTARPHGKPSQTDQTLTTRPQGKPSQADQTLTRKPQNGKTNRDEQTLTVGRRSEKTKSPLTLTSGKKREYNRSSRTLTIRPTGTRSDRTLSRTAGKGTGELVDKVNWEIGDIIDGRFEVKEIIGQGGMGIVYRVNHREWKLDLAVKMPLAFLVADESSKARFIQEAQTWVDLGLHPNIVQCWYVRELGGVPRVFMDYIGGGSLKDWIVQGRVKPGEWDKILDLVIQACDGLGYAHELGVEVHRDVKPGNMLLTERGDLLVTDFGIVKREGVADIVTVGSGESSENSGHTLTVTGSELGTPEYGAPEQWGKAKHADARADIYALGVILFELCCGRRPFDDGSHTEPSHVIIGRHISAHAPNPKEFNSNLPSPLEEIILRCLEKNPEKRPNTMVELRQEFAEIYREIVGKHYRRMIPQAADLRSDALNNRAASLLDLDNRPEAFEAWNEALKLDAYHPESVYNKALLQWRDNRITDDDVVRQQEEARHVSKRSNFYLGFIHLERAAAEEAEDEFLDALDDNELAQNGSLWRALGDARLSQEKYSEAEEAYRKALELIPGDSESQERQILAKIKTRTLQQHTLFRWQRCCCSFQSGHQGGVTSIAITSDGKYIVSASEDKTLRLWSLTTREWLRTFKGHEDKVLSVSVTPDGRHAVSGSRDKTLRLWDLSTGKCLRTFRGHTDWVNIVAVLPDGRRAVSVSRDKTLRLWDFSTGRCLWISEKFENKMNALAVTPDGKYGLSGHDEENLYLWDLATGKLTERKYYGSSLEVLGFYWSAVTSLAITPDLQYAVAGNQNALLRIWNFNTGQVLRNLKGHDEKVSSVAVVPNGRFVLSGSEDTNVCLWDLDAHECIWTFDGHKGGISQIATTNNGRFAVSGSLDSTLKLWNLETRECVWTFWGNQGHKEGVTAVTLALHGRFIVSGSQDMTLRLWDRATGKCLRTYEGHKKDVTAVAVTPDGRFAVSGSRDATLWLWDLGTTNYLRVFEGHKNDVTAVTISPDGKYIISGSEDKTLRLWNLATGECLKTFSGHEDGVSAVEITPDGRFIVSGSHDTTLKVWNLSSGRCLRTFKGHRGGISALALTADGRFIVSGSHDSTLRLWHLSTGNSLRVFNGHKDRVSAVAVTPDKRFIVSGGDDRTLRLWNFTTTRCLRTFKGHRDGITSLVMAPDGQYVVSGSKDSTIRLWNLDAVETQHYEAPLQLCRQLNHEELQMSADRFRKRMAWAKTAWKNGKATAAYRYLTQARSIPGYERAPESLKLNATLGKSLPRNSLRGEWLLWAEEKHYKSVSTVAVTPDGRYAVSGSEDMTLRLWELATSKCLRLFDGHWLGVTSVVITPDGRFAVSGSEDTSLRLWDLATGNCLRVYEGHKQEVTTVSVTLYGRFIVSGSKDGTLRMWNPSTTKCLQVFRGHKEGISAVAITPDRRCVISGGEDRTLRVWERATGKCLEILKGHKQSVNAVAVTSDGRFLLSGSQDQTLRLWNLSTLKCILVLKGHDDGVTSLTMTPEGRFAISASSDRTLKLWDLAEGQCLWTFRGHKQGVSSVAMTPNGRYIISGSHDNTLRLCELDWELDTSETVVTIGEQESKGASFLNTITSFFTTKKK